MVCGLADAVLPCVSTAVLSGETGQKNASKDIVGDYLLAGFAFAIDVFYGEQ